jgi:hypothetical protein
MRIKLDVEASGHCISLVNKNSVQHLEMQLQFNSLLEYFKAGTVT